MSPHDALCVLYKLLPDWKGHIYLAFWLFQLKVLFIEVPWSLSCSIVCDLESVYVYLQWSFDIFCIHADSIPYFFLSLI